MQVTGSSSSLYYVELLKQRTQQNQQSEKSRFGEADSDGSGGVSVSEFAALLSNAGTGATNAAEAVLATDETTSSTDAVTNRPPPPPQGAAPAMSDEEIESLFTEADSDGDGILSEEEFALLEEQMRPSDPPPSNSGQSGQANTDLLSQLSATSTYDGNSLSEQSSVVSLFTEMLKNYGSSSLSEKSMTAYMKNLLKDAYGA